MSKKKNVWQVYLTATKTATRPSELVGIADPWIAYQFDNAVVLVGAGIENAAQELMKTGSGDNVEMKPRYTMTQLLDPDFRLPLTPKEKPIGQEVKGVQGILFDEVK